MHGVMMVSLSMCKKQQKSNSNVPVATGHQQFAMFSIRLQHQGL